MFSCINKGYVVDAFDVQALAALEAGIAGQWYPQYLATVVIAIDRGQTDVEISGWGDLLMAREDVAVTDMQPHLH